MALSGGGVEKRPSHGPHTWRAPGAQLTGGWCPRLWRSEVTVIRQIEMTPLNVPFLCLHFPASCRFDPLEKYLPPSSLQ